MTTDHTTADQLGPDAATWTAPRPAESATATTGREHEIAAALGQLGADFTAAVLIAADAETATDLDSLADQLAVLAGALEHATRRVTAITDAVAEHGQADDPELLDPKASKAALREALLPGLLDRVVAGVWG
ncbi:hypothetical protein AB0H71_33675 [Nocardia sp. NPDC050697]|uniref:hypothetical protein n=1 Tax=Nocardia sp. NPDC050697 TaxID=3155158 RepID=UPI0033CA4C57